MNEITVNGEIYVKKAHIPTGSRAVIVVDRGWIYAGDVTEENGRIYLDRAVWVKKWSSCWFDGVLTDPAKAEIAKLSHRVDIPAHSEVYRIPVNAEWGL